VSDRPNTILSRRLTFGNVRLGSVATEMGCPRYVRFPPNSDRRTGSRDVSNVPTTEVAAPVRSFRRDRHNLAALVIRAARLAAILLGIAKGLQHADKGSARL
jgi:hypothetical protein